MCVCVGLARSVRSYVTFAVEVDPERPVLIDKYLDRCVCDTRVPMRVCARLCRA